MCREYHFHFLSEAEETRGEQAIHLWSQASGTLMKRTCESWLKLFCLQLADNTASPTGTPFIEQWI